MLQLNPSTLRLHRSKPKEPYSTRVIEPQDTTPHQHQQQPGQLVQPTPVNRQETDDIPDSSPTERVSSKRKLTSTEKEQTRNLYRTILKYWGEHYNLETSESRSRWLGPD